MKQVINKLKTAGRIILLACFIMGSVGCDDSEIKPTPELTAEESARIHTEYLSETIGKRVVGTQGEKLAREYIADEFRKLGYDPQVQIFTLEDEGTLIESGNVIATISGQFDKSVIVGAHYDSVPQGTGTGATDNAAAIGVMLVIADMLQQESLPYSVTFVAFGVEEHVLAEGLMGSSYYASQMTQQDIQDTVCMINLDTLAGGDKIYVYGGEGDGGWIRDQALSIAQGMDIPLETNPGLHPDYPAGTTGDWSDHAPFKRLGIPYAYFESTNCEIGELDGYDQTVEYGPIWHTDMDTLAFLDNAYPGRIDRQLKSFVVVLEELLYSLNPPLSLKRAGKGVPKTIIKTTRRGVPFD